MRKAVIYARFSSDKQTEDSIEAQVRACREYAGSHGFSIVEIYADEAVSGKGSKTAQRRQYQRLLRDCDKGTFDTILIHKYDRIARSLGEHVNLEARLKEKGVRLAVATASDESIFVPTLKRTGILPLFDCFTTVGEVHKSKDFPDVYLRAAEKLGLPAAACVVFEDVPAAIRSAKSGGFFTVGLCSPGADDRVRECADVAISGYADLAE